MAALVLDITPEVKPASSASVTSYRVSEAFEFVPQATVRSVSVTAGMFAAVGALGFVAFSLPVGTSAQAESSGAVEVGGRLAKLIPVARQALLETRHYMHDLSPMLSEQGDIRSALENLAAEFQNISDIEVDLNITSLHTNDQRLELEPEAATQICRIIQEALANVLRHSGASKVTVNVEHRPTGLSMSIVDDGRGFDSASVSGGLGLGHIASRAEELGGKFEVISSEGAGTRVLIELPPQKETTAK